MTSFVAWLCTAAVVAVVGHALNDPRSMLVMFVVSLMLPEDLFFEED